MRASFYMPKGYNLGYGSDAYPTNKGVTLHNVTIAGSTITGQSRRLSSTEWNTGSQIIGHLHDTLPQEVLEMIHAVTLTFGGRPSEGLSWHFKLTIDDQYADKKNTNWHNLEVQSGLEVNTANPAETAAAISAGLRRELIKLATVHQDMSTLLGGAATLLR
jgi:hypothetical protein